MPDFKTGLAPPLGFGRCAQPELNTGDGLADIGGGDRLAEDVSHLQDLGEYLPKLIDGHANGDSTRIELLYMASSFRGECADGISGRVLSRHAEVGMTVVVDGLGLLCLGLCHLHLCRLSLGGHTTAAAAAFRGANLPAGSGGRVRRTDRGRPRRATLGVT